VPPSFPVLTTVVLDPAHGGSDPGARGAAGAVESEIVLDFARAIRVALEAQGLRVILTREGNQGPSLDERSAAINGVRGALFISLHVSSTGPVGTARAYSYISEAGSAPASRSGLVAWNQAQQTHVDDSRRLAGFVQTELAQRFNGSPAAPSVAAVRQLRTIAAPAVAIEVSSVAVPDLKRLAEMGQPLADAVARAVVDFRRDAGAGTASGGK